MRVVNKVQDIYKSVLLRRNGQLTAAGYLSEDECDISNAELQAMSENVNHWRNNSLVFQFCISNVELLLNIKAAMFYRKHADVRNDKAIKEYCEFNDIKVIEHKNSFKGAA